MISYTALAELLARADAVDDAAEYHGTLCGVCCGMPGAGPAAWVERALAAADAAPHPPQECRLALEAVGHDLHAALTGGELEFAPLLRTTTVRSPSGPSRSRWCGFLRARRRRRRRDARSRATRRGVAISPGSPAWP
jgi:hypothetical protein